MKIIFAPSAIVSLQEIVDFLEARWTVKELELLENDIEKFMENLNSKILSYQKVNPHSSLRVALIAKKQVKIFFDLGEESADVLLFWANKKDLKDLQKLLKR